MGVREMSDTAEKVFRHGPYEIPLYGRCAICSGLFRQPGNGRPRLLCRRRRCTRERHNQQRRKYEGRGARVWTHADRQEAELLWKGYCAVCDQPLALEQWLPTAYQGGITPVHLICLAERLPPRAAAWLARCKPGCPLPNPFAGGAK